MALVSLLLFNQHSSALICFIYRTGVACQIPFDK